MGLAGSEVAGHEQPGGLEALLEVVGSALEQGPDAAFDAGLTARPSRRTASWLGTPARSASMARRAWTRLTSPAVGAMNCARAVRRGGSPVLLPPLPRAGEGIGGEGFGPGDEVVRMHRCPDPHQGGQRGLGRY